MKFSSAAHLTGGGTISGDVTIGGDLTVTGSTAITTNEVIQGTSIIDVTNPEAFLVRKNGDLGDILIVDTTNNQIEMYNTVGINVTPTLGKLHINTSSSTNGIAINSTDSGASLIQFTNSTTGATANDGLKIGLGDDEVGLFRMQEAKDMVFQTDSTTRMTISSAGQVILNASPADHSAAPTLAFGDGDTGFYEHADDSLRIAISGSLKWTFAATETVNSSNVRILTETSSATNPVFIANGSYDDGVGGAANTVALITNSTAKLIVDDNSRISLSNNDAGYTTASGGSDSTSANTLFGYKAGNAIADGGHQNTFFGHNAGLLISTTDQNIAIGANALKAAGSFNSTIIGYNAGVTMTGGSNTAVGSNAMGSMLGGVSNVAIGRNSMDAMAGDDANNGGTRNVSIGNESMGAVNAGTHSSARSDDNIAIGYEALKGGTFSSSDKKLEGNIAIGSYALDATDTNAQTGTIAIGHNALTALTSGDGNTAIGYQAGAEIDDGNGNTILGYQAALTHAGGQYNVVIGWKAMDDTDAGGNSENSNNNVAIGANAMGGTWVNATTEFNVAIGTNSMAGALEGSVQNVGVGVSSLQSLTTGDNNVAVGYQAGDAITTDARVVAIGTTAYSAMVSTNGHDGTVTNGSGNTAIGYKSMTGLNDVNAFRNTMVGYETMVDCGSANASDNTALGFRALKSINNNSSDRNTAIGSSSLFSLTTGNQNVAMGTSTGATMTTSSNNVLIGHNSGTAISAGQITTDGTVAVGSLALAALTSGASNTAIGYEALKTAATEAQSVAIGYQSMSISANSTNNTMVGYKSGYDLSAGSDNNTGIGHNALSGTHGSGASEKNTAIGSGSMVGAIDGAAHNTALGYNTLAAVTSGDNNLALGSNAATALTTGSNNTVLGYNAMYRADGNAAATSDCIFIGSGAGSGAWGNYTSSNNTVIGTDAMNGALNGIAASVVIGHDAGQALTTGHNNVLIGASTNVGTATDASCVIIGQGNVSEGSNQTVIGCGSIWKMFSAEVTCNLGGTDENDPAHATPIGKIPHNACVVKAAVVMKTKNGTSSKNDHSLKLVLSSSSSGTDNTVLADVQELVGAGVTHSWNGAAATSAAADIDCSNNTGQNGTAYVSMALPNSRGSDDPVTQLASLDMRDGDRFIYLAFANGSHTDGDTNPASAPVCQVYVEYVGLQL